jgi:hypothetical protein
LGFNHVAPCDTFVKLKCCSNEAKEPLRAA